MRIIESVQEMHRARQILEEPVSMVATLGGMHRGHEVLLDHARDWGSSLVASLFLNPTQFNDPDDLERYPRDTDRDLAIFAAHAVDIVFKPSVEEMYPSGALTQVDPGPIADVLEGKHRPGHFRAVATVVTKILTVIRPNIAVWGAKDAQQNVVIRQLCDDLLMKVEHRLVPTVRDPDGLALSSRNQYLSSEERDAATTLYQALSEAGRLWREGTADARVLKRTVKEIVASEPLIALEYVSIADPGSLQELSEARAGALVLIAAVLGQARLIDNLVLA